MTTITLRLKILHPGVFISPNLQLSHPDSYFNRFTGNRPSLNYKKSHLAPRLRKIKRNEINNLSLNLTAAEYRYASELGMNFHNSKLLYTVVNLVFQVFSFFTKQRKKINRLWPVRCCRAIAAVTQPFFMLSSNAPPTSVVRFSAAVYVVSLAAVFWMSRNVPPKTAARETTVYGKERCVMSQRTAV